MKPLIFEKLTEVSQFKVNGLIKKIAQNDRATAGTPLEPFTWILDSPLHLQTIVNETEGFKTDGPDTGGRLSVLLQMELAPDVLYGEMRRGLGYVVAYNAPAELVEEVKAKIARGKLLKDLPSVRSAWK